MGSKGLISFQNVVKRFGKRNVLDNLNLKIDNGEFFGIVGLSGSGKTTMLNMLIGFSKPSSGKILFSDNEIWKKQHRISNYFGFSTQGGSTYGGLTVRENLKYFGKMYNMSKSDITARSTELLKLVELTGNENLLASELSTGMQKRLDIACALMHNPEVLILDEPTKDLDPFLRKEILAMLKKINHGGTTIVMTSHLLDEIETVSDKLAILHNGKIICCDTPLNLKNTYSQYDEMQLKTYPANYGDLAKSLQGLKLNKVVVKPESLIAYTSNAEGVLPKIWSIAKKRKEHIVELKLSKPSIEEIFESITGR
ncbi:MAG: ABC transporter ATP-binding protein [archaeon]